MSCHQWLQLRTNLLNPIKAPVHTTYYWFFWSQCSPQSCWKTSILTHTHTHTHTHQEQTTTTSPTTTTITITTLITPPTTTTITITTVITPVQYTQATPHTRPAPPFHSPHPCGGSPPRGTADHRWRSGGSSESHRGQSRSSQNCYTTTRKTYVSL